MGGGGGGGVIPTPPPGSTGTGLVLEGCLHDSDHSKSPMPFCTPGGGGGALIGSIGGVPSWHWAGGAISSVGEGGTN